MVSVNGLFYFFEGVAMSFFTIMAIQNLWQRGNRLRMILGGVLGYWALQYLLSVLFTSHFLSATRDFSQVINVIDMTAEPTCVFLLMELCRPGWLTLKKVIINELPFVALGAIYLLTHSQMVYYVLVGFMFAYGIVIIIIALVEIPRYNRFLRAHYSYEENITLRWVYVMLITFTLMLAIYIICALFDTVVGDVVYTVGSILCWSWVCYCIQRQESVLGELETSEAPEAEATSAEAVAAELPSLESAINVRFLDKQLYLDPHLKLGDMAKAVGTNRTYLSRYLNDVLKTNFYDYINALRLNDACLILKDSSEISLAVVAQMAGFNSYSTFRRTFMAKYGISPQEYRNQYL